MKALAPVKHFEKTELVGAYEHATNPNNTEALVVVDGLFNAGELDRLTQVKYPDIAAIRTILFQAAPDLMEAWAIARENMAMALGGGLDVEPASGSVYETMPDVGGDGYDVFRLDNSGYVEILSAYTVVRGISRFNAIRFPEAVDPQRIVNDQDDLEVEILGFREECRVDHTDWEDSEFEVTSGDHILVPGLPRPALYASHAGDVKNSYLLRNLWLAHDPADGELADLVARPRPVDWLNHRSF